MGKTVTALYDGEVLRPDSSLDLEPNRRYILTIEGAVPLKEKGDAWDVLEKLAGSIQAPPDWAEEHDHYLYGTAKRKCKGGT